MDSRAADRRPLRRLRSGMSVNRTWASAVSPDNKQFVAEVMSAAHPQDAGAESQAPCVDRGRREPSLGARHRCLLLEREAVPHARLCAGDGRNAGTDAGLIAHQGALVYVRA